ncbi:unnamed protein product [Protopolystoma xenopodis]|uniref:Uncharacterized protein n=1 Tax=Protopolystoma xenopodis TaxID=117903 RepID=A0A448XRC1_9PLAT|nr:unnamed protein product [Protopolystoma xenopodis]
MSEIHGPDAEGALDVALHCRVSKLSSKLLTHYAKAILLQKT